MKKKVLLGISLTATLIMGSTVGLFAKVLPPPVNQKLGVPDMKFANVSSNKQVLSYNFTRNDCLNALCHVSDAIVVDRHHVLVQTKNKQCLDCHKQVYDPISQGFVFAPYTDCLTCHTSSPHHTSAKALARDCQLCHQLLDNYADGHKMLTSTYSMITPQTHGRTVTDTQTGQPIIIGGCAACHQAGTELVNNVSKPISNNDDTHHAIGVDCTWCHNVAKAALDIRMCETCHGIKSLHNIQASSTGAATVVPGGEAAGYGHIGNNWDCWGCHGWYDKYDDLSPATAILIPQIFDRAFVVMAGQTATITINGLNFTNTDPRNGMTWNPQILINDQLIAPVTFTGTQLTVQIPVLPVGNYPIVISKDGVKSNPVNLTVQPYQVLKTAVLSGTTLTITGTGFGSQPAGVSTGMKLTVNGVTATIISWSDTKIVAAISGAKAGDTVIVNSLFGPVSNTLTVPTKKVRK